MDKTLPYLLYTNLKTIAPNKNCIKKTPSQTFKFVTQNVHSKTCPSHFKLSILPSHIGDLHHELLH
jgi:hypothetical protein